MRQCSELDFGDVFTWLWYYLFCYLMFLYIVCLVIEFLRFAVRQRL